MGRGSKGLSGLISSLKIVDVQRVPSILLNHDFGSFDNSGNGIAILQFEFIGAAAGDCALDKVVPDTNNHMGHHITQLNLFDCST